MGALADTVQRLGWVNSIFYLAALLIARLSGGRSRIIRYYFVAQPVPAPARARGGSKLTIRQAQAGDPIVAQFPRPRRVVARRFANGATCLVAHDADAFAGFIWLQFGPYDEDEVRCRYTTLPAERTAWDFDVYVHPTYRKGRTFARLWDAANDLLRERGVDWTVSRISAFNVESLRSHAHFGARRIRTATFVRLRSVQLLFTIGRPWVHVSLGPESPPQLRLHAPRHRPQAARDTPLPRKPAANCAALPPDA